MSPATELANSFDDGMRHCIALVDALQLASYAGAEVANATISSVTALLQQQLEIVQHSGAELAAMAESTAKASAVAA